MTDEQELETCSWCGRYTHRHMGAYYYGFDQTGDPVIDNILCSVASAGKGYHHTENWNETSADQPESYVALIQRAATVAAAELAALRRERDALREALEHARLKVREYGDLAMEYVRITRVVPSPHHERIAHESRLGLLRDLDSIDAALRGEGKA